MAASIHTGAVRAYDVIRMLQRDGHPTPLGEAIASYGRIFKSLHILTYVDDETYRRDIKGQSNLTEGRHDLGRTVFHGHKGEIYQRYHVGMEEQLGALGLVLNCIVLWNTSYMNAALEQLRAEGYDVSRTFTYVIAGTRNREQAVELARRIHGEVERDLLSKRLEIIHRRLDRIGAGRRVNAHEQIVKR